MSKRAEAEEAKEFEKRETLARWEEYQKTGEAVSNNAMMEWLNSWGADNSKPAPCRVALRPPPP